MPRPPLPVGTYGDITTRQLPDNAGWRSRASYRDFTGKRREISRWAPTKTAAEGALKTALIEATSTTGTASGKITKDSRLSALARRWLDDLEHADITANTRRVYRSTIDAHVLEGLGELRLRELTPDIVDTALQAIVRQGKPGAAKTTRSVLSSMFGTAVLMRAMPTNPIRDTSSIARKPKKAIRALTVDETEQLLADVADSERARDLDLPDLIEWMLGTGMRIGEALAVRDAVLVDDTVLVNSTVVRITGQGLQVQPFPKSAAGQRKLPLGGSLLQLVERRRSGLHVEAPHGVLFPSPRGKLRDPSNTSADLREVLSVLGRPEGSEEDGPWAWVTSHIFRKTVATRLDEAGFSAREIADILGHEKPSMTQDVYMGRYVVRREMAQVLDRSE